MAVPAVANIGDVAAMPIIVESALEFHNFVQVAFDGAKYIRFGAGSKALDLPRETVESFNQYVLYVRLKEPTTAYYIA